MHIPIKETSLQHTKTVIEEHDQPLTELQCFAPTGSSATQFIHQTLRDCRARAHRMIVRTRGKHLL